MPATGVAGCIVRAGAAEVLQLPGGSTMDLLAEGDGTAETMTVHRSVVSPGMPGAGPHQHHETTELIVVLAGAMRVLVGPAVHLVHAGDIVLIPPGLAHAFAATEVGVELLDVVTPGVERFDLFRSLADGSTVDEARFDTFAVASEAWVVQ